ncbi:MAG: general secretion pathway protein GspK, partial [Candidatus Omnitrophica bacterium]|nr:general secretion pathway protein GspK [Candidatus Omnitrophota bacterium]
PVPFGPGTFRYEILDERGKIPLNALRGLDEALAPLGINLLERLGFAPDAAQQLLDRLNETPGRPIQQLGELAALPGMTPELLDRLAQRVTAAGAGPVNINTAPAEVLTSLGLSSALAGRITTLYRAGPGPDGIEGTSDDGALTQPGQIQPVLSLNFGPLSPTDNACLTALIRHNPPLLGVSSSFFRVESEGRAGRHGIRKKVTSVLQRNGSGVPPLTRGWHES